MTLDRSEYFRQYRLKNAEKLKIRKKESRERCKEKIKAYRDANKVKHNEYRKKYYQDNIEKIKHQKYLNAERKANENK